MGKIIFNKKNGQTIWPTKWVLPVAALQKAGERTGVDYTNGVIIQHITRYTWFAGGPDGEIVSAAGDPDNYYEAWIVKNGVAQFHENAEEIIPGLAKAPAGTDDVWAVKGVSADWIMAQYGSAVYYPTMIDGDLEKLLFHAQGQPGSVIKAGDLRSRQAKSTQGTYYDNDLNNLLLNRNPKLPTSLPDDPRYMIAWKLDGSTGYATNNGSSGLMPERLQKFWNGQIRSTIASMIGPILPEF